MDGIFITTKSGLDHRPKSKKEIKEAIASDPASVLIEKTSLFDTGPGILLASSLKVGDKPIYFVGPDPYTKRNFYGSITRTAKGLVVK